RDRAGQDHRARHDREGRGGAEVHGERADQGATYGADPDSAAVAPRSAHSRASGNPVLSFFGSGSPLSRGRAAYVLLALRTPLASCATKSVTAFTVLALA